jgi:UDP-N-acetylmuramoyl-tripeptide--D-alanyl-D-alanine ligase
VPKLSLEDISGITCAGLHGTGATGRVFATGYSIDTRTIRPGDLFFALSGENADGHDFVTDAASRGAVGAVVAHPVGGLRPGFPQLVVGSVLEALQKLAAGVRRRLRVPVVGITGSNGKTTVKEMLAHAAGGRMSVHRSPENYNNHLGLPLSILGAGEEDEVLVVEVASNHRGEIRTLSEICRPDLAVVTNVGRAHLGYFDTLEEVAREKTDILRELPAGGSGVVNADDRILIQAAEKTGAGLVTFGISTPADRRAREVEATARGGTRFAVGGVRFHLAVPGIHNVYNSLAAALAAEMLGVPPEESARRLESFQPVRMRTYDLGGWTLIDDSYNANPDSVGAALDLLAGLKAKRRIAVLGQMLELGKHSADLHSEVGAYAAGVGVDLLVGIGGDMRRAVEEAKRRGLAEDRAVFFTGKSEALETLENCIRPGDAVLIKGSRRMGLEALGDRLRAVRPEGR